MLYTCKKCKYSTDNKSNYNKHLNTKKHTERKKPGPKKGSTNKVRTKKTGKGKYGCRFCECSYDDMRAYTRHLGKCPLRNGDANGDTMKEMIKLLGSTARASDKAMSALNYVMANFANAPPLEIIENRNIDSILYNGGDDDAYDSNEDKLYGLTVDRCILSKFRDNTLARYIGDGIIALYKKDEPSDQSLWASDCTRVSYVTKMNITKFKKSVWAPDKKGDVVASKIIDPILISVTKTITQRGDELDDVMDLLSAVTNGSLRNKILEYIAPVFSIDKMFLDK